MSWNTPYYFQISGKIVVLKHTHGHGMQQHLCVLPQQGTLSGVGGTGMHDFNLILMNDYINLYVRYIR